MNKWANLYNLKVTFSNCHKWDLDILAIDSNAVCMWIKSENDTESIYIINIKIELIQKQYRKVKNRFLAQSVKDNKS